MSPINILELRSVFGLGGGPEKTILLGTARTNREEFAITVCYIRDLRDPDHDLAARASNLAIDYVELPERHSFDWRVFPALRALCRERRIDLVHSHDYKTNLLAWLLWKTMGLKPLATAHGWTGDSWKERFVYYPGDKRILKRFPQVVAVSSEIRDELVRSGSSPEAVSVILNGIDPARFQRRSGLGAVVRQEMQIPPDAIVLGAVGRVEAQKRFDLLIDAFGLLRSRFPSLKLVIAGEGSLRQALLQQVDRMGLRGECLLVGHCTDVPRIHHAFDVFVQSSDYEGTPNAVLEAMAMETPVAATTAGGTAELIHDQVHGIVVERGSAQTLAAAVERLVVDPALRQRLAQAARRRVEGPLSFETRMRAVERIYREMSGDPEALRTARA